MMNAECPEFKTMNTNYTINENQKTVKECWLCSFFS